MFKKIVLLRLVYFVRLFFMLLKLCLQLLFYIQSVGDHSHVADIREVICKKEIAKLCQTAVETHDSTREVVANSLNVPIECASVMPTIRQMEKES